MDRSDIVTHSEYDCVYVHGATASMLARFLAPTVPWVWILDHCPNPIVQWWQATIPLSTSGAAFTGRVRNMGFDIQMPTTEFLSRVSDFDDHGLNLIQSNHPIPDTLELYRISNANQHKVLMQNGATLTIYLPHAAETSMVTSYAKGYLETVIGEGERS